MITYQTVLNDLIARFGDKVLLTPEDIAPIIARSPAVQANLRYQERFPIPVKKDGRRVYVSIYHLAEYIATGNVLLEKKPEPVEPVIKVKPKTNKGVDDKSWQFALMNISQFTYELAKAVEYEELQIELEHKEPTKRSKAERGII
nr:hypothetical protein [uncultured Massilia sp.]